MLCSNFVKFGRWEIGEIVRYLPDKKNLPCPPAIAYCADCAQNLPGPAPNNVLTECSRYHPNQFTFGGVVTERVNTAKSESNICLKPNFEPNNESNTGICNLNVKKCIWFVAFST